jgi:hypothetical protein
MLPGGVPDCSAGQPEQQRVPAMLAIHHQLQPRGILISLTAAVPGGSS